MTENKVKLSRRGFLETTSLSVAGLMLGSSTRSALGAVKGANERIHVGVIGPGAQGASLIRQLATMENVKITTVCDIFEPNLKRGVQLAGGEPKPLTDYRKVLENKEVDAVVIATPLHLHAEMAQAALDAGKHIYLEKSLAHSVAQCDQLVRAAKARPSLVVQIGFQRHYNPVVQKAIDMARNGALGTITHIRCTWHRNGNWRRPVPQVNFDPRPWGYPDLEHLINWRMYKKYSQGLMAELGSHMMEVAALIFGALPAAVTGFGGIDFWKDGRETFDNVAVIYAYSGGQKVMFSSITTNAHYGERIQIMGTEATIDMGWDEALYFREKEPTELTKITGATVITATGETMPAEKAGQKGTELESEATGRVNPVYLALESFLSCIREGKKPGADVQLGRDVAVSVLLANKAMEEGRVIKF